MNRSCSLLALLLLFGGCASTTAPSRPATGLAPSNEVRDTVLRFYQQMRGGGTAGFEELISKDPAVMVIGSANEWFVGREKLRGAFRLVNQGLEAGKNPVAYENGDMGWFVDQPDWVFPDGSRFHTRFTAILQREAGTWKLVHWHLSVGVPDDEVVALQQRWSAK